MHAWNFIQEQRWREQTGRPTQPLLFRGSFWIKFAIFVLIMNIISFNPVLGVIVATAAIVILSGKKPKEVSQESEAEDQEPEEEPEEKIDLMKHFETPWFENTAEQIRKKAIESKSYLDAHKKLNERKAI